MRLVPTRLLPLELHRADRPSRTAQWTTLGRALELGREPSARIVSDPLAPLLLNRVNRLALGRVTAVARRDRLAPAVRAVERSAFAAIGTSALCRHRHIDAALLEALPEVAQVLILGAGYDTRAHRFATSIGERAVFEVDLAPISRRKAAIVAEHPSRFRSRQVVRVETDFRSEPLRATLSSAGLRLGAPTFVAWEGVSMYLDRDAVRATLRDLAAVCGPGSMLATDFFDRVTGGSPVDAFRRTAAHSLRLIGEPITFEPTPFEAGVLLGEAGVDVLETADATPMAQRSATGGRSCDRAMFTVLSALQ